MNRKKIAVVFGTRPDTIKLAPVIHELFRHQDHLEVVTISTAQHRQMLDQVLDVFGIKPAYDLNVMTSRQTLADLSATLLTGLDDIFEKEKPDMVLVQGDTSTTCIGSLAAFYRRIPVGHIEAGLRTNDKANPFPEEINRRITSFISDLHFAPTSSAKEALLNENIDPSTIFVTGNTVIDALNFSLRENHPFTHQAVNALIQEKRKIVLITLHRRENWGAPMENVCGAIRKLAEQYPALAFVFPVHLNPAVREVVFPILQHLSNVLLIEPLDYTEFVNLMARSYLILTDSGGVQEEGPHFGIPVLVLRSTTERPDAISSGTAIMVGTDEKRIFRTASQLIDHASDYDKMANAVNPYGDGLAAERTVRIILNYFGFTSEPVSEFRPALNPVLLQID